MQTIDHQSLRNIGFKDKGFKAKKEGVHSSKKAHTDHAHTFQSVMNRNQKKPSEYKNINKSLSKISKNVSKDKGTDEKLQTLEKETKDDIIQKTEKVKSEIVNVVKRDSQTKEVVVDEQSTESQTEAVETNIQIDVASIHALLEQLPKIQSLIASINGDGEDMGATSELEMIMADVKILNLKQVLKDLLPMHDNTELEGENKGKSLVLTSDQIAHLKLAVEELSSSVNINKGESDTLKTFEHLIMELNGHIKSLTQNSKDSDKLKDTSDLALRADAQFDEEIITPLQEKTASNQMQMSQEESDRAQTEPLKAVNENSSHRQIKSVSSDEAGTSKAITFSADTKNEEITTMSNIEKANQKIQDVRTMTRMNVFEQVKTAIVKQSIKAGDHSEMVIKLKPEELGKVELKIEVHNDNVIAKFNVASQMVKEAIESNLADLKNSLKDKGFSDMVFDVNVNKDPSNNNGRSNYHGQRQKRKFMTKVDAELGNENYVKTLSSMLNETTFEHLA